MSGPGIFMAQFYGKKNKEGVENCFRIKLMIGLIITILAIFLFYTFGNQLISLYLNDNPSDSLKTLNYGMDYLKNYAHWTYTFCDYTSLLFIS